MPILLRISVCEYHVNLINIYLNASLLFEAKYDGIFGELYKAAIYNIEYEK